MILEITDYFGTPVKLQPRVELYSVRDFMGREMPGLAIVLDEVMGEPDEMEPYATLTVSFGEFIGPAEDEWLLRIPALGLQEGISGGDRRRKLCRILPALRCVHESRRGDVRRRGFRW